MKKTFELTLGPTTYTLQRVDHPELFPAYNVRFEHHERQLEFRMEQGPAGWMRRPQSLPYYVNNDCTVLAAAIAENEWSLEEA